MISLVLALATLGADPTWHSDYATAMTEAKSSGKMLMVYFYAKTPIEQDELYKRLTTDNELKTLIQSYTLVHIPVNYQAKVGGKLIVLLHHSSFRWLERGPGIAIIDCTNPKDEHFGNVVSVYPLTIRNHLNKRFLTSLFRLPRGSLTQRTLTWAIRVHPEAPQSTYGNISEYLTEEAKSHSQYQASILLQGHHNWESRFRRITSRLGLFSAQEVCAESWPNESLVVAAIDCVDSWRQSPGHWSAVRSRHAMWGYDMKLGRNGIWYATGIFAGN